MPTTTELAKAANVKPNTIRYWAADYADYLGPAANPPKGETRVFTDLDAEVFMLIASMRADNVRPEKIAERLAEGERGIWPPFGNQAAQDDREGSQQGQQASLALVHQLTAKAANLEGALGAITEERDNLRERLEDTQAAHTDALERAIKAETELNVIKDAAENKRGFWARVLGR